MKLFMFKSLGIAALMFISVLAGMQLANDGIHRMKGYNDPNLQKAVTINDKGNDLHASVLGNQITSHDIETKKKKLEEMNAFNLFSSMGKKMSDGISSASKKLVDSISN
ncbi:YqxA family protein [Neobacillus cucumis]|uniref:YqxA family protein n=1 Tax=Neobacillus cucumis TaxID=1740721 RepID=UPI0018DF19FB|nr:YqxA family protein [Neobacillus cucumis]MBI0576408.1 YqxA family protein [Neobacillus cucumis]